MNNEIRKIKTQKGIAHSADFEENTWTFLMPEGYEVASGEFMIVDKAVYDELVNAANTNTDTVTKE